MAPDSKRRKLQHSSSEDDDGSSFASFASDEELLTPRNGTNGTVSTDAPQDLVEEASEGEHDDDGADSDISDGVEDETEGDTASAKMESPARPPPKKDAAAPKFGKPTNGRLPASVLTGGSIKTNVLKIQVDHLLERSRPVRTDRAEAAEKALRELKGIMEKLEPRGPKSISDAERDLIKKSRVAVPFPDPRPPQDAQYKLEFQKPASINVVGSYASSLYFRGNKTLEIDMMVQMPDSLFQPKDYQNHRYFYRRSYYLACIAAGVRDNSQSKYTVGFKNLHGNPSSPILVIRPSEMAIDAPSKWQVNILLCISSKVFADDKLVPSKSLVRSSEKLDESSTTSTSLYNSTIQADRQMTAYLKLIHSATSTCDFFKDAALLLRIWLKQRGFSSSIQAGGFGNFESTAMLAALVSTGALSPRYSAYQLFRAALQFLATKDALRSVVALGQTTMTLEHNPELPVIFDGPRSHNLLYKMTAWSYKSLRTEARNTIAMLGDASFDPFDAAFTLRQDTTHLKSDVVLTIGNQYLADQVKSDYQITATHRHLYQVLVQALGDRAAQISLKSDEQGSWELGSARPAWMNKGNTSISIRLNSTSAGRTVDHGPSAEQKQEAAAFRKFWGEKAELRRFKDGSIVESLVWSPRESDQAVVLDIVQYVVARHFGESTAAAMQPQGGNVSKIIPYTGGLVAFQSTMEALKQLEDDIRSLEELPLTIRQIAAADEQACFSSIDIPSTSKPMDVVLQFESSSRWPNSLTAIQRTKAAFLLLIARLLRESNLSITCRVGLENPTSPVLNQSFLEISYPTSSFHLRLHHDLELTFLQSQLKSPTLSPPQREETALALASYKRTFLHLPSHTSYIAKLSTSFPALSPSIRLLKQWFSSHHLTNHFPAPLIELLALHPFLVPYPYPVPSSPKTGLLRALAHLATWDWRTTPLLLPPSDSEDKESWRRTALTRFEAWRKLDPSLNRVVLFAAYGCDNEGTAWTDTTQGGPGRVVASRMTSLAQAAMEEVQKLEMDPRGLFVSGTGDYDFVLHLDLAALGDKKGKARGKGVFKNLELQIREEGMEGFEPVGLFLEEIQAVYGVAVVLFYGGRGSDRICGLWNPVTERRGWKVGLGWSSVPVKQGEEVVVGLNKEGILGEMARLGGELVRKVEVVKH
ncbi:Nrap protein nucleotidyltransferase domain 4-containing protein [Elsinoe fawcettii]|nr:Nrap protein nucleotidyltransferase domain 4-containing protein [Elsinoe fawcettii]